MVRARHSSGQRLCFAPIAILALLLPAAPAVAKDADTSPTGTAVVVSDTLAATNEFDGLRDPFWPVGYEPAPPEPEKKAEQDTPLDAREAEVVIDWPALRLRGLTKSAGGTYMGLIEGLGWVEKGDCVRCVRKDILYEWIISDVRQEGVRCERTAATPMSEIRAREQALREQQAEELLEEPE